MDTPSQFRTRFDFLEREFGFALSNFQSTTAHMLNINAIYSRPDCRIEIEREGSRVHTLVALGSESAKPIDYLLKRVGLDPSVQIDFNGDYDYFGSLTGLDEESQAAALRRLLSSIVGAPDSMDWQGT